MKRVFILGAGFSKAVNIDMPTMPELRDRIVRNFMSTAMPGQLWPDDFGNDLERWLSHLASDPPWLDRPTQLRNQALYLEVSGLIDEAIRAISIHALQESPPGWLLKLVRYWHRCQETVITFNYDVIVERAYMQARLEDNAGEGQGYAVDLYTLPLTPLATREGSIASPDRVASFQLLKLHGSTSWLYSGADGGRSDTIFDVGLFQREWPTIDAPDWRFDEDRLRADKFPLIVPPVATKTGFYENSALRVQWRAAAEAIRSAEEIVLMGYSLPESDLVVRDLLATNLNPDAHVVAVDRRRNLGRSMAARLAIESDRVDAVAFCGHAEPIDRWVRTCAT